MTLVRYLKLDRLFTQCPTRTLSAIMGAPQASPATGFAYDGCIDPP